MRFFCLLRFKIASRRAEQNHEAHPPIQIEHGGEDEDKSQTVPEDAGDYPGPAAFTAPTSLMHADTKRPEGNP